MTKERPILFSGPMVRAILEGRKTQTRRVFKGSNFDLSLWMAGQANPTSNNPNVKVKCPYGKPGDRLWVRETFNVLATGEHPDWDIKGVSYKADDGFVEAEGKLKGRNTYGLGWKPSIHMPRWASRILLEIIAVRVEQVKDISEADAMAEGVGVELPGHLEGNPDQYRQTFQAIWKRINGQASWDENPWVWVVEFKVVEAK